MKLGVQQQRIMDLLSTDGWVTHFAIGQGVAKAYTKRAYRGLEPSIEGLVKRGLVKQIDLRVPEGHPFGHFEFRDGHATRVAEEGPWEFASIADLSEAERSSLDAAIVGHPNAQRFVLLVR